MNESRICSENHLATIRELEMWLLVDAKNWFSVSAALAHGYTVTRAVRDEPENCFGNGVQLCYHGRHW